MPQQLASPRWSKTDLERVAKWREQGKTYAWIDARLGRPRGATCQKLSHQSTRKKADESIPCLCCGKPFLTPDRKRVRICWRCKAQPSAGNFDVAHTVRAPR